MKRIGERLPASPAPATGAPARPSVSAGDCGLLLLRLAVGLLMAGHGAQKLFGMFGGRGLAATGRGFATLGYHPGRVYAATCGLGELLGGLGLAVGLFTPLAAAALIGVMINAMVTVTSLHGLWETSGGMEYGIVITVAALAVAATGPGRLSLDLPFRWGKGGWREAGFALALGGAGTVVVLIL
ncbi:DoxX family protein [Streptomyces gilvosporeus]|uniref:DoxX family protein n=1 Tax=Streptomyces gilvosporeus TaxID=553510 RepID=A0A1V0TV74_9ACTN|nr:DoxX family membrane protein [Streptomyces gilvosporeus]ARF56817.1 DoxX family protein [Streptomyces gilvosporeus]